MEVTMDWLSHPKGFPEGTTRSEWNGKMDAVPRVGETVTLYGPEKDIRGFHEVLDHGVVVQVL